MNSNEPKNLTNQRARAAEYIKRGWLPLPVMFMGEEPLHPDWQNLRIEEKDVDRLFPNEPTNIAVRLGDVSGRLLDVHIVDKDALRFTHFLPRTGTTFGPASARSSHWLYQIPHDDYDLCDLLRWGAAGIGTILELRGDGQMAVFPDSINESGEPITFEKDSGPEAFRDDDLAHKKGIPEAYINAEDYICDCIIQVAVATVLYKRWNPEDPSSLVQSMTKLLLGYGWLATTIEDLIRAVEREVGAGGQEKVYRAVFKETRRAALSGLADCLGEETARDIGNWHLVNPVQFPSPQKLAGRSGALMQLTTTCFYGLGTGGSDIFKRFNSPLGKRPSFLGPFARAPLAASQSVFFNWLASGDFLGCAATIRVRDQRQSR